MIQFLKKLNLDGIEIHLADPDTLLSLNIDSENISYLQSLQHISIHAPWKDMVYRKDKKTKRVLNSLRELKIQINAKVIVIHKKQIEDFEIFKDFSDLPFAIENDDWKVKNGIKTIGDMRNFINNHSNWDIVLDIAHALTVGGYNLINEFIDAFGSNIVQMHASMLNRDMSDHTFLYKHDNKQMKNTIKKMKLLNVPLILEVVAKTKKEVDEIIKEIAYIENI